MKQPDGTFRKTRRSLPEAGYAHELTFSCYHGLPLLSKDRTRQWLMEAIDRARRKYGIQIWSYVIMLEHVHILVNMPRSQIGIADILKAIKQPVARKAIAFLRTNAPDWLERLKVVRPQGRSVYHFWQPGGGYDRNIESARVAWNVVDYIHANPVRRGLCMHPAEWPWSSAAWYEGRQDVKLLMDGRPPEA